MNELNIIENELIPVYETSTGEKLVYVYANALTSKNRKEKRYEYR